MKYTRLAILIFCLPGWLQPAGAGPVLCIHEDQTHLHSQGTDHDCHHDQHETQDGHHHAVQFELAPCCTDIPLEQDVVTDKIKTRSTGLETLLRAEAVRLAFTTVTKPTLVQSLDQHRHLADGLRSVILLI